MFRFLAESCFSKLIGTRGKAIMFNTGVVTLVVLKPVL